jgi:hypothetical protein
MHNKSKPQKRQRGMDALDHAVSGGAFESNRRRH